MAGRRKHSPLILGVWAVFAASLFVAAVEPAPADAQTAFNTYQQAVIDDGATAYWTFDDLPFEEVIGDVTTDFDPDLMQSSLTPLDAGSSIILEPPLLAFSVPPTTPNLLAVTPGTTVSVEAWVATTSDGSTSIAGQSLNQIQNDSGYFIGTTFDGLIRATIENDSGSLTIVSSQPINDGMFHYVVLTYDGFTGPSQGVLELYIDGVSVGTDTNAGGPIEYPSFSMFDSALHGPLLGLASAGSFLVVDELAIYPTALTAAQVDNHYTLATMPPPPSPSMYEVTPAEMYGLARPSTTSVADPVEPSSGNFFDNWTDLTFGGAANRLNFNRTYNSLDDRVGVLGQGWSTMLDATVTAVGADVEVRTPDGRVAVFVDDGNGGWVRPREFEADLVSTAGVFSVEFFDGMSWLFDTRGRLASVEWWDGQQIQIGRDTGGVPLSVTWMSGMGGSMSFNITVDGDDLISGLTADDGRTVAYGRDTAGFLTSVTGPDGATQTYTVDTNGVIGEIFDEEARLVIRNTYDVDGRVVLQETATGVTVTFVYDDAVGTTTVSDSASGDVTVYQHNALRQLVGITDTLGMSVSRSYDVDGNLTAAVDRRGELVGQVFDSNGNLTSSTDELGQVTSVSYDGEDRVTAVTDPDGDVTSYTYSGVSRVPDSVTDPSGAATSYVSVNGLISSVTDADGVTTSLVYDTSRNLVSSTNGVGNTTTHTYDSLGRRLSTTSPSGATSSTTYDLEGRRLSSTDRVGAVTTFMYDGSGALVSTTDPTGAVSASTYDSDGRTDTVTDPNGRVTSFSYNGNGDLIAVTDPDGETTSFTVGPLGRGEGSTDATGVSSLFGFDESGNLISSSDADGNTTTTTFDEAGRPISTTDASGNIRSTTYDVEGRVAARIDEVGNVTSFTYDSNGRLASTVLADGTVESRTFTMAGRLATTTDGNGNVTSYSYDTAGRISTVTDPSGGVSTASYDGDGRVVSTVSGEGLETTATYDAAGRRLSTTDPTGAVASAAYTARGAVAVVADPNGATTGFVFDAAGQLVTATDPNSGVTSYGYDGTGRRTSRTSVAGGVEGWTFDGADRPLSRTNQIGQTASTVYDSLGRVSTVTDASGRTMTLAYDSVGQITQIVYSDGAGSYTVSYAYDAAGRVVSQTDPDGVWQYVYDVRNRLTGVTEPDGSTLAYGYDAVGNRTSFTYPDGTTATYGFDALNRLTSVDHPDLGSTAYTYDADGRLLTESLPDGNSRAWIYTDGRVTSYTDTQIGTTTITYDTAGRMLSTVGAENWIFTYDPAGQLLTADRDGRTWAYDYDNVGNLVSVDDSVDGATTFTVDAAGRLTGGTDPDGDLSFEYDTAGRLTQETSGDGTIVDWTYDIRGLPATITTSSGDGGDDAPGCDASLVFTIVGTPGDDVITGTAGDDIIAGLGGDDVIDGLGGDDIICAGKGADTVYGGAGDDLIVGGRGADILYGNGGADTIRGRRGGDEIYGGAGSDRLHGGRGNDLVVGGGGDDLMFSGAGDDVLRGGNGDDELHARKGADVLRGNAGDDLLFGGKGPDTLFGGKGADELHGRRGADTLYGGAGPDILDGGVGVNDVLDGGNGVDVCDDGETNIACETVTAIGTANNPTGSTPIVTTVETRVYDGLGALVEVDIDGEASEFVWDQALGVPQIVEQSTAGSVSSLIYGLGRVGEVSNVGSTVFAYTVTGDSTELADWFTPYGQPVNPTGLDVIGFGYRSELQIDGRVHLRARDLTPSLARFTSVDPLDGRTGTVVETNPYPYANNDPINLIDPLGLTPGSGLRPGDPIYGAAIGAIPDPIPPTEEGFIREATRIFELAALSTFRAFPITGGCGELEGSLPLTGAPIPLDLSFVPGPFPFGGVVLPPLGFGGALQGCFAVDANSGDVGIVYGAGAGLSVTVGSATAGAGPFFANADTIDDLAGPSLCAEVTVVGAFGVGGAICFSITTRPLSNWVQERLGGDPGGSYEAGIIDVDFSSWFGEVFGATGYGFQGGLFYTESRVYRVDVDGGVRNVVDALQDPFGTANRAQGFVDRTKDLFGIGGGFRF